MLAFLLATAVVIDTPHKAKPVRQVPPPAMQGVRQTTSAPLLSSVAVTLECTARANGQVEACHILGETHPGLGFGETAIALMRGQTVAPSTRDIQFARTIQFMP